MLRAIALSLAILIGLGTIIPLATETTEAGPKKVRKKKQKREWRGVKKYSKRWWQLYRAQERRKRAVAARKRALRLKQIRLEAAAAKVENPESGPTVTKSAPASQESKVQTLPSGDAAPNGWKAAQASPAELQFRVDNTSGDQVGSAAISVVGPAVSGYSGPRSVGGVSTTTLRREVIDRMIRENGWVVNDYQKNISGQSVYVVVAQSQAKNGAVQSRMFYFTEVDGRIYSVATNSPANESERLAEESEKVINSLKTRVRPALRASTER